MKLNVRNGTEDGYFRVSVSAGDETIGLVPTTYLSPNVIIFQKRLHLLRNGTEKEALLQADECFITTSIQELIPIRRLGIKQFAGNQGAVYQKLHARYIELIKGSSF